MPESTVSESGGAAATPPGDDPASVPAPPAGAGQALRAYATVLEMLTDRGLCCGPPGSGQDGAGDGAGSGHDAPTDAEILEMLEASPTGTVIARPSPRVAVVLHTGSVSVSKKDVQAAAEGADRVVVVAGAMSSVTRNSIGSLPESAPFADRPVPLRVEIFTLQETQYNVSRHRLVPRHERVPEEEALGILERLGLPNRFMLPVILSSDPMARYLDLRHGDLVRISRDSPTAGSHIAYRACWQNSKSCAG